MGTIRAIMMVHLKRIVFMGKVEKIFKGSLDLIPSHSPSAKIQIIGGNVLFEAMNNKDVHVH